MPGHESCLAATSCCPALATAIQPGLESMSSSSAEYYLPLRQTVLSSLLFNSGLQACLSVYDGSNFLQGQSSPKQHSLSTITEHVQKGSESFPDKVKIPTDGIDVWEINASLLKFHNKVASGSFGDLFKGTYCSQEVAIKVLKPERVNFDMLKEFSQEVFIMRSVRLHAHSCDSCMMRALLFDGHVSVLTEFMSKGSVYNFLHKERGVFTLPTLLKVAIDVSKGMNYLHQNNIIHRDLKTANLLMDENEVVKVADFGVARVQAQTGVMTAETGTYRWMAPEIIEHKPYDHRADVFSFGIVLWELLTGEVSFLAFSLENSFICFYQLSASLQWHSLI
ncbi:unnamed protein product [Ilex paraguariensis]|uniref:Protein kinase domain-containing protein n=1 Tax=Ilex paraguariensis TaxID=185542 RepID=A0ABC8RDH6_9AQUA